MSSSTERLADRCLFPGFAGPTAPDWVRRRAAQGLGGVVLYARNIESPEQLQALNASLHAERPGLLIAIDEEGGDVTRIEARTGSSYPGNLALGAAGDVTLTQAVAAAMGADLAFAGVDLDLAPDADVNSNAANPVIGVRSFGSQPSIVAAHAYTWVKGLQGAGVAACIKHFPGHGDTAVDSHLALPVAGDDPDRGALAPFRAGILAGVQVVMSAHIVVPWVDSIPATISPLVMTNLLRGKLGFEGLVMTDGLEMRAISDGVGILEGAVQSLAAGCDALCIGGGLAGEDIVIELRTAIAAAVAAGRLSEERLADAASRVDRLAAWRAGQSARPPRARDQSVGLTAARRAIRADGEVQIGDDAVVVRLTPQARSIAAGEVPWGLAAPLAERGVKVTSIEIAGPPAVVEDVATQAAGRSLVIVVRDLHRHAWAAAAADELLSRRPDAVVVEMGVPACRPHGASAYVATHGAARVCGMAAAEALAP